MARERWGGRFGVIMAVAGSAIGLGNFLRFPGQAAQNGGGAFMIPYFVALLLLGLPLMWIEWTIGRFGGGFGHSTAPGMFHTLWNKNRFIKYFGVIGIFGPVVIFIYYTYIESWLLGYSLFALTGAYSKCTTRETMGAFLNGYLGLEPNAIVTSVEGFLDRALGVKVVIPPIAPAYFFFLVTFALNIAVVYRGLQKGIERVCRYALPVLFLFAIILMVRIFTLSAPNPAEPQNNVWNGLGFLWNPDWSALVSAKVWLAAAGQIFFTLSVGIGVILTYTSYLTKEDDVALSGLTAASANEFAEVVLGGSIVIPAAFAFFGAAATAEIARGGVFNLGFVSMPLVLERIPLSGLFGFMWFMLLFLAGITSSISLAQPAVAFLEDEFNLTKKEAVVVFAVETFVLMQPAIFFIGNGVVDELDFWGGTFFLVVFATVEVILFGWVFGMDKAWTELHAGSDITIPRFYRFIIKFITPLVLLTILGVWLYQEWVAKMTLKGVPAANKPYIIGTRLMLGAVLVTLVLMLWLTWKRREGRKEA